jgi:hypothetical protein
MKSRGAAALALTCFCLVSAQVTRAQPTLSLRPAFLPLPNTMNESADPARFKPAPPNVVLYQLFLLPGWVKEREFDDLCKWLTEQGFVIVRANGPEPWRTYPEIKFRTNVGKFNQAFHVTVMERSAGFPWCYSVFTDPVMPSRFAGKNTKFIEGYSLDKGGSGVGPSCD